VEDLATLDDGFGEYGEGVEEDGRDDLSGMYLEGLFGVILLC
jgi:hypothetical protein